MHNMRSKAKITIRFTASILVLCGLICLANPKLAVLNCRELDDLLTTISPWPPEGVPASKEYSRTNWNRLLTLAKYVKGCEPESVIKALTEYENRSPFRKAIIDLDKLSDHTLPQFDANAFEKLIGEDAKLFLLMRVVFALPEHAPSRPRFYPWHENHTDINPDDTVNVSWPITWTNGRPELMSGDPGIQGVVDLYLPAEEYSYFLRHYPMRDLTSVTNMPPKK
jgi:hypothetical protein